MDATRKSSSGFITKLTKTPAGVFLLVIILAFVAFEMFNFSTTLYAFDSIFVDALSYWSWILAIAFCGMDIAGLARLFTPEQGGDEPIEVWYLFGAWILAAAMNATLTWWGVSMAMEGVVLPLFAKNSGKIIPVFVAILVWIIRILLVGTFAVKGDAFLNAKKPVSSMRQPTPPTSLRVPPTPQSQQNRSQYQPQHRPAYNNQPPNKKPEPTYRSLFQKDDN